MPLNDLKVKTAKPGAKAQKLADERGLYLLLKPTGAKLWRYDYRHGGKRKTLALGVYPDTTLAAARRGTRAARRGHIDPSAAKQAVKAAERARTEDCFEAVAREWFAKFSPNWAKTHVDKIIRRFELNLFPWLGARPSAEIEPAELLAVLR